MNPPPPPVQYEAERAVLGAFLLQGQLVVPYVDTLDLTAFHKEQCRYVWSAIRTLHQVGTPIDALTVRAELRRRGVFAEAGGDTFLAVLQEEGTVATQVEPYIALLREAALRREIVTLGGRLIGGATTGQSISELLDALGRFAPRHAPPAPPVRFQPAAVVLEEPPLIAVVEGVAWQGRVTVLVSESGAGKTFVLLDLAAAVSDRLDWHGRAVCPGSVAYISFEGDALGLRLRALQEAGFALTHVYVLHAGEPLSPRVAFDGTESISAGERQLATALAALAEQLAAAGAPPLSLLIVDTVRASLVGSEDTSDTIAAYLRAVRRLLAPYPTAGAILAHHAGWQEGEGGRKRERGSSAFRGNVDATLYLEVTGVNWELGITDLALTALKVRDEARPAPLRLLRTTVPLSTVDAEGRAHRTCRIESDSRSPQDLADERARETAAQEAALDQRALRLIGQGGITSVKALRHRLEVRYEVAEAVLMRLLQAGRVQAPGRQREAYTPVAPSGTE
jgi:AAA domain/DnaB-like helicase N terminal domain